MVALSTPAHGINYGGDSPSCTCGWGSVINANANVDAVNAHIARMTVRSVHHIVTVKKHTMCGCGWGSLAPHPTHEEVRLHIEKELRTSAVSIPQVRHSALYSPDTRTYSCKCGFVSIEPSSSSAINNHVITKNQADRWEAERLVSIPSPPAPKHQVLIEPTIDGSGRSNYYCTCGWMPSTPAARKSPDAAMEHVAEQNSPPRPVEPENPAHYNRITSVSGDRWDSHDCACGWAPDLKIYITQEALSAAVDKHVADMVTYADGAYFDGDTNVPSIPAAEDYPEQPWDYHRAVTGYRSTRVHCKCGWAPSPEIKDIDTLDKVNWHIREKKNLADQRINSVQAGELIAPSLSIPAVTFPPKKVPDTGLIENTMSAEDLKPETTVDPPPALKLTGEPQTAKLHNPQEDKPGTMAEAVEAIELAIEAYYRLKFPGEIVSDWFVAASLTSDNEGRGWKYQTAYITSEAAPQAVLGTAEIGLSRLRDALGA